MMHVYVGLLGKLRLKGNQIVWRDILLHSSKELSSTEQHKMTVLICLCTISGVRLR